MGIKRYQTLFLKAFKGRTGGGGCEWGTDRHCVHMSPAPPPFPYIIYPSILRLYWRPYPSLPPPPFSDH